MKFSNPWLIERHRSSCSEPIFQGTIESKVLPLTLVNQCSASVVNRLGTITQNRPTLDKGGEAKCAGYYVYSLFSGFVNHTSAITITNTYVCKYLKYNFRSNIEVQSLQISRLVRRLLSLQHFGRFDYPLISLEIRLVRWIPAGLKSILTFNDVIQRLLTEPKGFHTDMLHSIKDINPIEMY